MLDPRIPPASAAMAAAGREAASRGGSRNRAAAEAEPHEAGQRHDELGEHQHRHAHRHDRGPTAQHRRHADRRGDKGDRQEPSREAEQVLGASR